VLLSVRDLHVSYGRVPALRGVSFDVAEGEMVCIVGPNGAGKSTCMRTVAGICTPVSGAVNLGGDRIEGDPPETIARRGVSLVPEGRHIFAQLTVEENLQLGTVMRRNNKEDWDRTLDHFAFLRSRLNTAAGKLSGGEQQQLVIARALLTRPTLLLLDEPSLGLAPQVVDLIYGILAGLRETGITMLVVEQSMSRVLEVADRVYVLRTGEIALSGAAHDLRQSPELAEAYFGFAPEAIPQ